MTDVWIVVRNWSRFQHYKDRQPPWIKNYTELMSDDAYRSLPLGTRGVLHGLWMEYARGRRLLRGDSRSVSRALGQRVLTAQLEALNQAGFITLTASKPGASNTRVGEEDLRPEENTPQPEPTPAAPTEEKAPDDVAADPTLEWTPNEIRDRAFQTYRAHGGNLTLEKPRSALARNITTLINEKVDARTIIAAAADLGRTDTFPGYLKQRAAEITANGGPCRNQGLDRSQLPPADLQKCPCPRCTERADAHEAKA